jgi:CDP-4-dehydro-6-deoxyglucose reductase, E3
VAVEHEARVARIVEHAPDTRSLLLAGPRLAHRPGQFISCLLPVGGETIIRPYSISSDPEDDLLEICLNLVPGGPGSAHLFALRVGAAVRFTGPWGTFVLDRAPDAEVVFIADGTGIAPIRPMIRRALATATGRAVRLLHAAPAGTPLVYGEEHARRAQEVGGFEFDHVPSPTLHTEVVRRWVEADRDRTRRFFVCGVGGVVPALRDVLRGAGYERRAVQYEKW